MTKKEECLVYDVAKFLEVLVRDSGMSKSPRCKSDVTGEDLTFEDLKERVEEFVASRKGE